MCLFVEHQRMILKFIRKIISRDLNIHFHTGSEHFSGKILADDQFISMAKSIEDAFVSFCSQTMIKVAEQDIMKIVSEMYLNSHQTSDNTKSELPTLLHNILQQCLAERLQKVASWCSSSFEANFLPMLEIACDNKYRTAFHSKEITTSSKIEEDFNVQSKYGVHKLTVNKSKHENEDTTVRLSDKKIFRKRDNRSTEVKKIKDSQLSDHDADSKEKDARIESKHKKTNANIQFQDLEIEQKLKDLASAADNIGLPFFVYDSTLES